MLQIRTQAWSKFSVRNQEQSNLKEESGTKQFIMTRIQEHTTATTQDWNEVIYSRVQIKITGKNSRTQLFKGKNQESKT